MADGAAQDVQHGEFVEAAPEQPPFRQERLEPLLNTIKQDLNQLVRK